MGITLRLGAKSGCAMVGKLMTPPGLKDYLENVALELPIGGEFEPSPISSVIERAESLNSV